MLPAFLIPLLSLLAPVVVPAVIKAVLPKVILEAEKELPMPGKGALKKEWVTDMFRDIIAILEAHGILNERWNRIINSVLPSLSEMIDKKVEKMKKKGQL